MRRREFIALFGGTAAVAVALPARAQKPSWPTVGFLVSASAAGYEAVMGPVLKGLGEADAQTGFL